MSGMKLRDSVSATDIRLPVYTLAQHRTFVSE